MKQELVELQPKLEKAKLDNATMMKVELYRYSFVGFSVSMCILGIHNFTFTLISFERGISVIQCTAVSQLVVAGF